VLGEEQRLLAVLLNEPCYGSWTDGIMGREISGSELDSASLMPRI
jgi:hypothetical protein